MPNIIIIEEDPKITHDMTTYLKEMGEGYNVRTFKKPELFLKKYNYISDNKTSFNSENYVAYSDDDLKNIANQKYSKAEFSSAKELKFIAKEDWVISKISASSPGTMGGLNPDQIMGQANFWNDYIHPNTKQVFEKVKSELSEKATSKSINVIFQNKGVLWFLNLNITKTNDVYEITIQDHSSKATEHSKRALAERHEDDSNEQEMLSEVDLVVVNANLLDKDVNKWFALTFNQLRKSGFFKENSRTRFVVTKYEEERFIKSTYDSPFIDDLLCLPLDRVLFKQKVEIILSLPEKVKPSFLFSQPVELEIVVTKKLDVEQINDLGFAFKSTSPLKPGTTSIIYFKFPGDEQANFSMAKVTKSTLHPDDPKKYLVYFDFFAIDRKTLLHIKTKLRDKVDYKEFLSEEEEDFVYNEENIFLNEEDRRLKTIALINSDKENLAAHVQGVKENFDQVKVIQSHTFYEFKKQYLNSNRAKPLEDEDIYDTGVRWSIHPLSQDLIAVENKPEETDLICSLPANDYFIDESSWKKLFKQDDETQDYITSALKTATDFEQTFVVEIVHGDKKGRLVAIDFLLEGEIVRLNLRAPKLSEIQSEQITSLEAIVVSSNFITENATVWIDNLRQQAKESHLVSSGKRLEVIVLLEEDTPKESIKQLFDIPGVNALWKPADSRTLFYQISRVTGCNFTKFCPDNIGFYKTNIKAYTGKETIVEEISEFGASVKSPFPIKPGVMIYLHDNIYSNAPEGNICAKSYACETNSNEGGKGFLCHLIYFGINDTFLKFTRTWIREQYAQKKSKNA